MILDVPNLRNAKCCQNCKSCIHISGSSYCNVDGFKPKGATTTLVHSEEWKKASKELDEWVEGREISTHQVCDYFQEK